MSTTTGVVLDASAILALLQEEQGADEVERLLDGASMACINLSEVIQKADQHGVETEGLEYDLEALGIEFRDFGMSMARPTAELWSAGSGLALGDRACLALAQTMDAIAVTTDGQWTEASLPLDVRVIR